MGSTVSEEEDLDYPGPLSPNHESWSEHPSGLSRRTSTSSITATFDSSTALSFTTTNISGRGWDADRSGEGCWRYLLLYFKCITKTQNLLDTTMSRILSPSSTAATSRRSSLASATATPSRFLKGTYPPRL